MSEAAALARPTGLQLPPRMPRWRVRCDLHDWPTCVGWCPVCAEDHRAGLHTCQAGISIGDQEAHEHDVVEHPHTCAWCYPLPAHDRPTTKALGTYSSWSTGQRFTAGT